MLRLIALLLFFFVSTGQADDRESIAIRDVAVIPMTDTGLREHQTVLIQGDRIVAVGPVGEIDVPARRYSGGRYRSASRF